MDSTQAGQVVILIFILLDIAFTIVVGYVVEHHIGKLKELINEKIKK